MNNGNIMEWIIVGLSALFFIFINDKEADTVGLICIIIIGGIAISVTSVFLHLF